MRHEVKSYCDRFEVISSGTCKADIRLNDKVYTAGDKIVFKEGYDDISGYTYTGRSIEAKITYIDSYVVGTIGYVSLSLELVK